MKRMKFKKILCEILGFIIDRIGSVVPAADDPWII